MKKNQKLSAGFIVIFLIGFIFGYFIYPPTFSRNIESNRKNLKLPHITAIKLQNIQEGVGINGEKKSEISKIPKINIESATIEIDYGNEKNISYKDKIDKNNETLFEFMKKILEKNNVMLEYKDFSGLGIMIEKIGDKKNGEDNKYWQYWINDNYAKVGADSYIIKAEDKIKWKFEKQQSF